MSRIICTSHLMSFADGGLILSKYGYLYPCGAIFVVLEGINIILNRIAPLSIKPTGKEI